MPHWLQRAPRGTPAEKDQIEKSDRGAPRTIFHDGNSSLTRGERPRPTFMLRRFSARAIWLLPGRYTEPRPHGEFIRLLHEISSKSSINSKELIAWVETIF